MRVAILGASGHLSQCAFWVFFQNPNNEIFLFSRSPEKLHQIKQYQEISTKQVYFKEYTQFNTSDYDVIFNGVGVWDTPGSDPRNIFAATEHYDDLIIQYQKKHPGSISIHISSGAAYATDYMNPIHYGSKTLLDINHISTGDYYSIAKINSEAKHRAFDGLNIVDIRLFGFFSRFMSLEYHYFLSAIIKAIRNKVEFTTVRENFWRDYIHMDDFLSLLHGIAFAPKINMSIDVRSSMPVSKNELLQWFMENYDLKVCNDDTIAVSMTGIKYQYFSEIENAIYTPQYSSKQTIENEIKYFLGGNP